VPTQRQDNNTDRITSTQRLCKRRYRKTMSHTQGDRSPSPKPKTAPPRSTRHLNVVPPNPGIEGTHLRTGEGGKEDVPRHLLQGGRRRLQNIVGVVDATVGQRLGEETPRSKAREVATARDEDDVSRSVPEVDRAPTMTRAPSTAHTTEGGGL
jgi:hypothetical protein